jgi:hypothetical protein
VLYLDGEIKTNQYKGLYNLQYLFKATAENLHCNQQHDLPSVGRGIAEGVESDCVSTT